MNLYILIILAEVFTPTGVTYVPVAQHFVGATVISVCHEEAKKVIAQQESGARYVHTCRKA